jgi:hypothetical protein
MPLMCPGLPTPLVPNDALSGLAFNQAMRPIWSFGGTAFFVTIRNGLLEKHRNWLEVLKNVVGKSVYCTVHYVRVPETHDERVSIASRTRSPTDANATVRASYVLDDDRLTE